MYIMGLYEIMFITYDCKSAI